ncbi:MAG: hypothetical protein M1598_10345 [Actinobacteria bacterium]|nr:hypothetical protein [Actinomycetota bacterium]
MAGRDVSYTGSVISHKLKVAGIDLISLGEIDAPGQLESKARQDKEGGVYRKLVFRDGVLVGVILLGDSTGHQEIARAIAEKRPPVGVSA